jgi:hypothetical protein
VGDNVVCGIGEGIAGGLEDMAGGLDIVGSGFEMVERSLEVVLSKVAFGVEVVLGNAVLGGLLVGFITGRVVVDLTTIFAVVEIVLPGARETRRFCSRPGQWSV